MKGLVSSAHQRRVTTVSIAATGYERKFAKLPLRSLLRDDHDTLHKLCLRDIFL